MASQNPLNVYTGPDAVQQYFNPELNPPLPLVEIPQVLNPYYNDGVRIFAKMMSMHPANNVKIMPGKTRKLMMSLATDQDVAMNMLSKEVEQEKTKTVVEYVTSMYELHVRYTLTSYKVFLRLHGDLAGLDFSHLPPHQRCPSLLEQQNHAPKAAIDAVLRAQYVSKEMIAMCRTPGTINSSR
jgi:hypothetical protein